jgi:MFS family permease
MKRELHWTDFFILSSYSLGLSSAAGIITPILLPYLVALFMPAELQNTYLAILRVIGLAVAMLMQPLAGLFSDRCTSRWGRRRPFITFGALGSSLAVIVIGFSPLFLDSPADDFFRPAFGIPLAYAVLLGGLVLVQFFSNIAQGAQQALIPDIVPDDQRGRASGVKATLEMMAIFLVLLSGPLLDRGAVFPVVGIIIAGYLVTMLITDLGVKETPLVEKNSERMREPALRLVALMVIFVGITQAALWLVQFSSGRLISLRASLLIEILLLGLAGLGAMAGAILVGVYLGAWVGIGGEARHQRGFIWWIINRLLFLAGVGSIQGFTQYYLRDVIHVTNPASATAQLLTVVGVFIIPAALGGGALADRFGLKRMVRLAGWVAAGGALLLLFARSMPLVMAGGAIIGLGTGTFLATNWALGTELVPSGDAGRYLGISNLAGAGAGIVGAGIGGPLADFFNGIQPGLGYLVIFAIYTALLLISTLVLARIRPGLRKEN